MASRTSLETLESLRVTLHKLEQTTDPSSDVQAVAELKQILLNRMAELETLNALAPQQPEAAPAPADLPPLPAITEEETREMVSAVPLEKLD
jgi:hypothetical protein